MKYLSILAVIPLILLVVSLSGCTFMGIELPELGGGGITPTGGTGLSVSLTTDTAEVKSGSPATFIATVKNLADENATAIKTTLNITGWNVANPTKSLSLLTPEEGHKFSWVLYAPVETGSYSPNANVFYIMKTRKNIKVRIYDNDYLNTLSSEKRKTIGETSALQSQTGSTNTPITISISLQQPFILTQSTQEFPFVITIQDVGSGETYEPVSYLLGKEQKDKVLFSYSGNHLTCDVTSGSDINLEDGSKGIACKFTVSKGTVSDYLDATANFTVEYAYLTKGSATIKVVE